MNDMELQLQEWTSAFQQWMSQWGNDSQDALSGLEAGLQLLEDSNSLMQAPDIQLAASLDLYRNSNALAHLLQTALDTVQQELETLQSQPE